ncbi:MAG: nucleoside deaminase [Burkholderiaceae bacterium]|nr:nucleoside deaminase [Burkholderiaceae bacterium]
MAGAAVAAGAAGADRAAVGADLPRLQCVGVHLPFAFRHLDQAAGVPQRDRPARLAHLLGDDGGFCHLHRGGRAAGFPDRLLAPGLHRHLPADDGLQRAAQGGLHPDPGGVVRHRRGPGGADGLLDLVLPHHGEHRHRPGHAGAGAGRRAARAGRQALGRAHQGRPAALHALLLGFAQGGHHAGLRGHHGVGDDGRQRGHRLPADLRRLLHADGPGLRRPAGGGCDGDGDVRAVQLRREAHHGLGPPRLAEPLSVRPALAPAQVLAALRRAIAVAEQAQAAGHHPFGALLLAPDGDTVLLEQGNVDTVRHAESELARAAALRWPADYLWQCTLVTTVEPCAMCAGTQYWAHIGRVVYGMTERRLLELTGNHGENPTMDLPCREVFAHGQKPIEVIGPVPEVEAGIAAVHRAFWAARR